jgi:hypothetical protein
MFGKCSSFQPHRQALGHGSPHPRNASADIAQLAWNAVFGDEGGRVAEAIDEIEAAPAG